MCQKFLSLGSFQGTSLPCFIMVGPSPLNRQNITFALTTSRCFGGVAQQRRSYVTPLETSHLVESVITTFGHGVELRITVGTHRASSKLILFGRDIPSRDFLLDPLDVHVLFKLFSGCKVAVSIDNFNVRLVRFLELVQCQSNGPSLPAVDGKFKFSCLILITSFQINEWCFITASNTVVNFPGLANLQ